MKQTVGLISILLAYLGNSLIAEPANCTVPPPKESPKTYPALEATCVGTNMMTCIMNTVNAYEDSGSLLMGSVGIAAGTASLYFSTRENAMCPPILRATGILSVVFGFMGLASPFKASNSIDLSGSRNILIRPLAQFSEMTTSAGIEIKIEF